LGVKNSANSTATDRFNPEAVPYSILDEYIKFARALSEALRTHELSPAPDTAGVEDVRVVNEVPEITSAIKNSMDFAEFMSRGMPKINAIFLRHGLLCASTKSSAYEEIRERLAKFGFDSDADSGKLEAWVHECTGEIYKVIPEALKNRSKIKVFTLLMFPIPAASSKNVNINIFLSLDKIAGGGLKKVLFGELAFRLSESILTDLGLPPRLIEFYSHGLRYALPARMLGLSLDETLGFSKQKFEDCQKNSTKLRELIEFHLSEEMCCLYEGKYHKYFRRRHMNDPYRAGSEAFSGYGSFLAAVEVFDLLESGKLYEKILSF
jgi:hypothetical protein